MEIKPCELKHRRPADGQQLKEEQIGRRNYKPWSQSNIGMLKFTNFGNSNQCLNRISRISQEMDPRLTMSMPDYWRLKQKEQQLIAKLQLRLKMCTCLLRGLVQKTQTHIIFIYTDRFRMINDAFEKTGTNKSWCWGCVWICSRAGPRAELRAKWCNTQNKNYA